MTKLLVCYAHPGHRYSTANRAILAQARLVKGITLVDLYAEYPRFDIDIDKEQDRLLDHDVILFQFRLFWYSTPSLVKEWLDLVLELGFAYGAGGDKLCGKRLMIAITAAGPRDEYTTQGYQQFPLRVSPGCDLVDRMPRAHDCRDTGGRATQEQLLTGM